MGGVILGVLGSESLEPGRLSIGFSNYACVSSASRMYARARLCNFLLYAYFAGMTSVYTHDVLHVFSVLYSLLAHTYRLIQMRSTLATRMAGMGCGTISVGYRSVHSKNDGCLPLVI